MDEFVVQYLVDNYPTAARPCSSLAQRPWVTRPLYFAVNRARPDAETIVNRFNGQLGMMIVDCTYHRLARLMDRDGHSWGKRSPNSSRPATSPAPSEPRRAYALSMTTGQPTPKQPPKRSRASTSGKHLSGLGLSSEPIQGRRSARPDASRSTAALSDSRGNSRQRKKTYSPGERYLGQRGAARFGWGIGARAIPTISIRRHDSQFKTVSWPARRLPSPAHAEALRSRPPRQAPRHRFG